MIYGKTKRALCGNVISTAVDCVEEGMFLLPAAISGAISFSEGGF
jgi:hypothetical protein